MSKVVVFIFLLLGSLINFVKISRTDGLINIGKLNLTKSISCENGADNVVTMQTLVNEGDEANGYIVEQASAIVYYKCPAYFVNPLLKEGQFYSFLKVCGHQLIQCVSGDSSCRTMTMSPSSKATVILNLLNDVRYLRIMTVRCSEDLAVFRLFANNIFANFSDNPVDVFTIEMASLKHIRLTVSEMIKTTIMDFVFNITKSKCTVGFHRNTLDDRGHKCSLRVNGRLIEGGYKHWQCNYDDVMGNYSGTNLCSSYTDLNKKLCRNRCFNLPNCNYLCASDYGGHLLEDAIGTDEPNPLGLLDECKYNVRMCELGNKYCQDTTNGFICTTGEVHMKNCLAAKSKSPYWKCPVTMSAFNSPGLLQIAENAILFKKDIMNVFQNKSEKKEDIQMMYNILEKLSPNKTQVASFNLPVEEKANLAGFLVNRLVEDFVAYSEKNNNTAFESESLVFKSVQIEATKPEMAIPIFLPEKNEENHDIIRMEVHRTNVTKKASLLLFRNLDFMGEKMAVNSMVKSLRENATPDKSDDDDNDDEDTKLYKNSDMFSLKVDRGAANVKKVSYKLNTHEKIGPSTTWMYEVEHACGILDKTKNWTWNQSGCKLATREGESMCECEHLSNFAMLISMRKINTHHLRILQVLSVIGGIINVVSFLLFIVFILAINTRDKLRLDLLNIALCLLLATVAFMVGSFFVRSPGLCAAVAMVTEFLFLSAFVWKLILGFNVIGTLAFSAHYKEQWMTQYRMVMITIGYGIPLIIVVIFGASFPLQYRSVANSVCWIMAPSPAFLSFFVPISIVLALNTVAIFFIAATFIRNHVRTRDIKVHKVNKELMVFIQLVVSMGLTWLPSYFAIVYLSAMYLFVGLFPLQGLMMFLLVVVVPKSNREKVFSFLTPNSTVRSSLLKEKTSKDQQNTEKVAGEDDKLLSITETSNSTQGVVEVSLTNRQGDCVSRC